MRIYGTKLQIAGANIKWEYFPFSEKEKKRESNIKEQEREKTKNRLILSAMLDCRF